MEVNKARRCGKVSPNELGSFKRHVFVCVLPRFGLPPCQGMVRIWKQQNGSTGKVERSLTCFELIGGQSAFEQTMRSFQCRRGYWYLNALEDKESRTTSSFAWEHKDIQYAAETDSGKSVFGETSLSSRNFGGPGWAPDSGNMGQKREAGTQGNAEVHWQ